MLMVREIAAQAVALAAGEAHHHERIVPQSPRPGSCEHNRNRGGGFRRLEGATGLGAESPFYKPGIQLNGTDQGFG